MGGTMSSITINGDTSGSVILQAPSVAGSTTLTLPSTSGTVLTSANTFANSGGPAFSAYRSSSAQNVTSGVWTKVQLNTEDFDTANCFDSSTNYRFTPTVAGYYQINGSIAPDSTSSFGNGLLVSIYKNGTLYRISSAYNTTAATVSTPTVSTIIYFNGSTDYVELYGQFIGGVGMQFSTNNNSTSFSGCLVRGA